MTTSLLDSQPPALPGFSAGSEAAVRCGVAKDFTAADLFTQRPSVYAEAVRMLTQGATVSMVARVLAVSRNTVALVRAREMGSRTVDQLRKDLAGQARTCAGLILDRLTEVLMEREDLEPQHLAQCLHRAVEASEILSGGVAGRVEGAGAGDVTPAQVGAYLAELRHGYQARAREMDLEGVGRIPHAGGPAGADGLRGGGVGADGAGSGVDLAVPVEGVQVGPATGAHDGPACDTPLHRNGLRESAPVMMPPARGFGGTDGAAGALRPCGLEGAAAGEDAGAGAGERSGVGAGASAQGGGGGPARGGGGLVHQSVQSSGILDQVHGVQP